MIKATIIVTHDGTGDWKTPDTIIETYEKEFEDRKSLGEWETKQNQHPWLTIHIASTEEI